MYEETIDPRAKSQCILCWNFIDKKDYIKSGNYCTKCNSACVSLSKLYPYDVIENPKNKEEYEERRDTKMKWYKKETANFQYYLSEQRRRMEIFLNKDNDL